MNSQIAFGRLEDQRPAMMISRQPDVIDATNLMRELKKTFPDEWQIVHLEIIKPAPPANVRTSETPDGIILPG